MIINFIINDEIVNNDDALIILGNLPKDKIITYKDLIDINLKNTLRTKDTLINNLRKIEEFLNSQEYFNFQIKGLKKGSSTKFEKLFEKKQKCENLCFLFECKELFDNKFNAFSIVCDVLRKSGDLKFDLFVRRIELFNWQLVLNKKSKEYEVKFHLYHNIDKDISTEIGVFKNYSPIFFDDDDYKNDLLNIDKWFNILSPLKEKYSKSINTENKLIFKLFNNIYLLTKSKLNFNGKIFLAPFNDDTNMQNEINIKEFKYNEISSKDLLKPINNQIGEFEIKINNFKKEITEIEESINKVLNNDKTNKQENDKKISTFKKQKVFIKEQLEKVNQNIECFQKLKDKLKEVIDYFQIKYFFKVSNIESISENEDKDEEKNIKNMFKDISNQINNITDLMFFIITKNQAKKTLINRNYFALLKLNKGIYRDPYLYTSIKEPTNIVDLEKNTISQDTLDKFKLNNNQLYSVKRALNSDHIFYLQGPPGTGKTQTICAIANETIINNKNVVICSSTHEAISNFLERLDINNWNNPNLIIFKYQFIDKNIKKKENDFGEDKLFSNFLNKVYNFIGVEKNEDSLNKKLNDKKLNNLFMTKIDKSSTNVFTIFLLLNLFKRVNPNEIYHLINKPDLNDENIWPFDDIYNPNSILSEIAEVEKRFNKHLIQKLKVDNFNEINELIYDLLVKNSKIEEKIKNIKNLVELDKLTLKDILSLGKTPKSNNFINALKNIKNKDICLIDDKNEENIFLDYIFENQIINIIGITTTSRQTIKINNKEKNLFSDYLVDLMIIDEVSKSTTPEIISKLVLAKKTILSGDYLQLPPNVDFDSDDIDCLLKEKDLGFTDPQQLEIHLEELFKNSFFKFQIIEKIKKSSRLDYKPYSYLNESNRFHNKILDAVNLIYQRNSEPLIEPENFDFEKYYKSNKVNFKVNGQNYVNDLLIFDLNKIVDEFLDFHYIDEKTKIKNLDSFDQKGECFKPKEFDLSLKIDSLYNQYSAWVIVRIIKRLLNDNNENNFKKIGVIALTKTQKFLIIEYCKKSKIDFSKIKIDTIDSFQGREEDVIIVDFIRGKTKIENKKIQNLSHERNISFLGSIERINVAISRARKKLILVGYFSNYLSKESKLKHNKYGNLFEYYLNIANSDGKNLGTIKVDEFIKDSYENKN